MREEKDISRAKDGMNFAQREALTARDEIGAHGALKSWDHLHVSSIITGYLKRFLKQWMEGSNSECLSHVHLHIHNPALVIAQKTREQARGDTSRGKESTSENEEE